MTNRERVNAILHYKQADRLPLIHFGYWYETMQKWQEEGHIGPDIQIGGCGDDNEALAKALGFDFGWQPFLSSGSGMNPCFEPKRLEDRPDGSYLMRDVYGVTVIMKDGAGSIPAEVDHMLQDRVSWDADFKHRFQYFDARVPDYSSLKDTVPEDPRGMHAGSLFGLLRDIIGVVNISYMFADDEELYKEIIDTNADTAYKCLENVFSQGIKCDYVHFWEDICFKNGPLISPAVFSEFVGPHYKRISDLCHTNGVDIISLDCDGCIDALLPIWLENGVNVMFPIEVGTWEASIAPWREKYGKGILGVGGMDKRVFGMDYAAIDKEIERLKPMIEAGGYIPCPDHRIPPDAVFENVQYYTDKMRRTFDWS